MPHSAPCLTSWEPKETEQVCGRSGGCACSICQLHANTNRRQWLYKSAIFKMLTRSSNADYRLSGMSVIQRCKPWSNVVSGELTAGKGNFTLHSATWQTNIKGETSMQLGLWVTLIRYVSSLSNTFSFIKPEAWSGPGRLSVVNGALPLMTYVRTAP